MSRRPMDIAPVGRVRLPDSGLGRGWEPAAVMGSTLLLLSFGLVSLYSASSVLALRQSLPDTYYVLRQAAGAGVGLGLLMVCAWLPYRLWERCAWPLLCVSVIGLIVVVLPWTESIAPASHGARRWLRFWGVGFQPSEVTKIAVIDWTAAYAVKKAPHFQSLRRGLGPFFAVWALVILLIVQEPDLSTAVVIGLLGVLVVFAGGARISHFLFLSVAVAPVLWSQFAVGFRAARKAVSATAGGCLFYVRTAFLVNHEVQHV